jgi:peptide subunit release factor 1 (eRF1)
MTATTFYAAIDNETYLADRDEFIRIKTKAYLVDKDKIEKQILAVIQGLRSEEKRLMEYRHERTLKYYDQISEDYRAWKQKTGQN